MDPKKEEGPGAASAEAQNANGLNGDDRQPTTSVQAGAAVSVTDLRLELQRAGFAPIPVDGKKPARDDWQTKAAVSAAEIKSWLVWPNTGLLTRISPALDIDILNQKAAKAVEDLVRDHFAQRGHIAVRVGLAPKRAILFTTTTPFDKITKNLTASDGSKQKLEFLSDGQQVVVAGIHEDTGQPYKWYGGSPGADFTRDDLPNIEEAEAHDIMTAAVEMLREEFGYELTGSQPSPGQPQSWGGLAANIMAGRALHDSIRDLAAKLITAGTNGGAATNFLYDLMDHSAEPKDDRWQERRDDIPRAVASAEEKFGTHANRDAKGERHAQGVLGNGAVDTGLGVWDAGLDIEPPPPRGWILGNVFCRMYLSSIFGDGAVGKTALRILQALSVATGRELTGEHVFFRGRVLILCLEDNADELRRRVLAARLHYGISTADVEGWLFLSAPGGEAGKLLSADNGRLVLGELAAKIETEIAAHKIDLVIVDPFVKTHSVEENTNASIDKVVQILADLTAKYNIGIDSPHHTSKGTPEPGNADRGRGASSMKDGFRLVDTITQMSDVEAATFGINPLTRRSYIRVDGGKVNIAAPMFEAKWYKIIGVPLGNGTAQYPSGDNVQTVERWYPPQIWADLTDNLKEEIVAEIDKGLPDGNRYSNAPKAGHRAAWKVVVKHMPDKGEAQAREIIKAWIKTGVLEEHDYFNSITRKDVKGLRKGPRKGNLGGLI